jgi:hypothetical protein
MGNAFIGDLVYYNSKSNGLIELGKIDFINFSDRIVLTDEGNGIDLDKMDFNGKIWITDEYVPKKENKK